VLLNVCEEQIVLKSVKLVVGFMVVLLLLGCSVDEDERSGKTEEPAQHEAAVSASVEQSVFVSIAPVKAHEMLSNRKDILFVDVRSAEEVAEIAIEGAQPIPMGRILLRHSVLPKDKPILLVCAVGGRSYGVGRYLAKQGYPEVYNLRGGIVAWEKEGLPVVKNNQNQKK
jgi:rhodanese-related sulfurtransferase